MVFMGVFFPIFIVHRFPGIVSWRFILIDLPSNTRLWHGVGRMHYSGRLSFVHVHFSLDFKR